MQIDNNNFIRDFFNKSFYRAVAVARKVTY